MTFTPFPGKIQIEPVNTNEEIIMRDDKKYEEMGKVIAVGEGVTFVKPGDTLFFLAYGCEQTPPVDGVSYYTVAEESRFIIGKMEHEV